MEKLYVFRIKRFLPDEPESERWDNFEIRLSETERVLDGLTKIKEELDGTLTFRRSCGHGVCGSCAMQINGVNRLACQTLVKDLPQIVEIKPLPALPVIKDLVVDMTPFFEKNDQVLPYLINPEPPPERERIQLPKDQQRIVESVKCIMCGCCTTACSIFKANRRYLGPSALLKAYRFLFDTRDKATTERLKKITTSDGIWRCHTMFNCSAVCPKGIDVTSHLLELKRFAIKRMFLSNKIFKGGSKT